MKLTPLDIEQQQFRQVMRGWDPEEVRRFLGQVGDRVEELIRENTTLRDELRRLEQQVGEFRAHEGQLRQALVSAGRMGDEIKESARKEADLLRAEAELQAEKIVAGARDDVVRYAEQARDLRLQKARLLGELRTVVDAHRRLLETHEALDREEEGRRAAEAEEVRRARARLRVADRAGEASAPPGERRGVALGPGIEGFATGAEGTSSAERGAARGVDEGPARAGGRPSGPPPPPNGRRGPG